jgi:hypothetical protein
MSEMLIKDISDRLTAIGQAIPDEAKLRTMISEQLSLLAQDEEFTRKMRFGGGGQERKLVGSKYARWGLSIGDVEFLYDLMESMRGQRMVNRNGIYEGPSEELRNTMGAISEAAYLSEAQVRDMDKKALDDMFPKLPISWFQGGDRALATRGAFELTEAYQRAIRAMDTAETGYGLQLVGAQYVGDLWTGGRRESRVMSLFDMFEMLAPTVYLPVEVDIPEMLFVAESTTSGASAYTSVKTGSNRVQVDAKKFAIRQLWSGEMDEDSIIPFVPFLNRQAMLSLAHYGDSVELNGDTTNAGTGNINLDDADPADTKHYLAMDGLRHAGIVDNTGNKKDLAGPLTVKALMDAKGRMIDATYLMDWGHPTAADDLVYITDPYTGDQLCQLDEVVNQFENRNMPILTGQVATVLGHPVVGSMAMSKTEADGKVSTTAGNNIKGQVCTVNRRGFKTGWRRRVRTETLRITGTDQTEVVHSLRFGFGRFTPTGAASGIEAADVIYDISL